ncbi:transaminase [Pseudaquidulcibacter saccharophilus]|uniref:transaminase n=1 Tax=Pseudaquidulcibacter saccharophilus TaxID=2831900 RepID=UPI001EFF4E53
MSGISDSITESNKPLVKRVNRDLLKKFIASARADYIAARPKCFAAHEITGKSGNATGFLGGVPQHWMLDWSTPFPLQIKSAKGCKVTDIDDNELIDLCLGDTGAMFGHSPEIIASALKDAAENGLTTMLPSQYCAEVGQKLVEIFGLPYWQLALSASDANRFALRVARLATGRQKILVFDGCYHGAVDETTVYLDGRGKTSAKPSLWGSAFDPAINTYCVPFNDKEEIYATLMGEDVACVIMEPALTNCGIVPPKPGFLEFVVETAHKFGTYVLFDETHTLSSGYGGYCRINNLGPDLFVAGKAVAGGVPTAIWGISEDVKQRLDDARAVLPIGHSGIGTTLGGSLLQLSALYGSLNQLVTPETYDKMLATAQILEDELNKIISEFSLDWSVIRIGARMEIIFSKTIPQNAEEMRALFDHELEEALHLGLLNLGFLVTPFHNMLLAGPDLTKENILNYAQSVRQIIGQICD